ncbi:fat-like cadherin-related tumor suppressor homolog [Cimex lectularius]|uniref:Cadherin domain-containing protein n=1 Tax=Cimex lectularius TaxID=79782 RepID=A0A8I6SFL3_CIMLE|nr:fat-like cadherin-related tumor suppressor homolog [Cimex lectularius]
MSSGEIRTRKILDAETKYSYWLTIICEDHGVVPLHSTLHVYVEVENINDNFPMSVKPIYEAWVLEESTEIMSVVQVLGMDADLKKSTLSYSIKSGNDLNYFSINETSGLIKTTGRKIDREIKDEYLLEVEIRDSMEPTLASIVRVIIRVKDINDNDPEFDQSYYHVTVPEVKTSNLFLIQDDESYEEGTISDEFFGAWENFPSHQNSGVQIFRVIASDKDIGEGGILNFSLNAGKGKGRFSIHPSTGIIYAEKPLLRGHLYNIKVMASDNGKPRKNSTARVTIKVVGVPVSSSHSPVFKTTDQYIELMESDEIGYMVWLAQATDSDSTDLYYNITSGDDMNYFSIGRDKGNVVIAKKLDKETQSSYNLTVSVTDGVHTAYTKLLIKVLDVNEHSPKLSLTEYNLAICECTRKGTVILNISATDEDYNSKFIYHIINAQSKESLKLFSIDYETGALSVTNSLDRESMAYHVLTVAVSDGGTPARRDFARININITDVNDHMPEFSVDVLDTRVYSVSTVGTKIATILATDMDEMENGTVRYSILSGNDGEKFKIDSILGELTLAKLLDSSSLFQYTLIIKAADSGVEQLHNTLPVHILISAPGDIPPKFQYKELSAEIYENSLPGSFVIQLEAHGWGLMFEITDGNVDSSFKINPTTGTITTNYELDREIRESYNLTVAAFNMVGGTNVCKVYIYILDQNDNMPQFLKTEWNAWILESADVGSFILDSDGKPLIPLASDKDHHINALLNYQFLTHNNSSMFHIDSNTGAIRTVVCLDYEKTPNMTLSLIVTDKGIPRLTSDTAAIIHLSVIDVNDSPPIFSQSQYNITMLWPTFDDVTIIRLNATDADSEGSTKLEYSIVDGNKNGICTINATTGLITVKDKTKLSLSSQKLRVAVTDGKYKTEAFVYINWMQIPNNYPKGLIFPKSGYLGAVLENSTQIVTVVVVSVSGTDLNEHIVFSILNPTPEFSIGEISGAIRTTGIPLDREKKEFYKFIIQAESSLTKRIARTEVNITVLDINDNCPIIANQNMIAVVSVSARKYHFIGKIIAFDYDKGENGEIHYEFERYSEYFKLCTKSGNITLRQQLPAQVREYNLVATIRDNGIPPCSNKMKIDIIVLDEETPVFEEQSYETTIPENIPLHSPIPLTLKALSPLNNDIIYSIEEGDLYEDFYVTFGAGSYAGTSPCVVKVQTKLDYEDTKKYTLTMKATDAVTNKFSNVLLHLYISDVNDNAPIFEMGIYNISVIKTLSIGGLITQIEAKDNDTGMAGVVRYVIDPDQSESMNFFHIRSETGEIFLKKPLNYELKKKHHFVVKAIDAGSPPLSSTAHIWINVIDVLDTAPQVIQPIEGLLYGSDVTRGQFVSFIRAYHTANVTKFKYSLLNYNHAFHLDKENGILIVANPKNISVHDFSLNISVSDGVYTTTTHLDINITPFNQHNPYFDKLIHEVTIKENVVPGSHVITLHAEDADVDMFGLIEYEIPSQEILRVFNINKKTGEIKTKLPLDKESKSYYEFIVLAIDNGKRTGFTTVCVTLLDSNDNPPVFSSPAYSATIFANTSMNTPFLKVHATDMDESTINYSILSNRKHNGIFSIHETTGEITLTTSIESQNDAAYQFFVRATDTASPSFFSDVSVTIIVTSNSFPSFFLKEKSHTFFMSEAAAPGSIITQLNANSEINVNFTLLGNESMIFEINKEGQVSTKKHLDREERALHRITILCETVTNPSFAFTYHITLHILDMNDNQPIFETKEYNAYIVEGTAEGTPVMKVTANDADEGKNGEIHYWLEDGMGHFTLDRSTGWILTLNPLDWEKQTEYTLTVVAFDNGSPALSGKCTINIHVIDINDNPPSFVKQLWNISVAEDVHIGTPLLSLQISDIDSSELPLKYFVIAGDNDCNFNVNSSGVLYLTRSLDREYIDNYMLTILATDGKFTALTKIAVEVTDVNDEKPQCKKSVYKIQVPEDVPRNSFITSIEAFDLDIKQKFKFLLHGDHSEHFTLNNLTGELKTRKLLDRERIPQYNLVVDVVDDDKNNKMWKCQSEVIVTIIDVNDSPPRFMSSNLSATILENAKAGSIITQIQATDDDLGVNSRVRYGMSSSKNFMISPKTGLIQLTKNLDREVQDKYTLTVTASDQGIPKLSTTATMVISVLDVNDNPPIFPKKVYSVKIPENIQINVEILKLEAFSADIGLNAEIFYSIVNGNDDGKFSLDPKSGILSAVQFLDYELVKTYLLTVEATDRGEPPLSSQALVNITVIDSNDNIPIFMQIIYTTSVYENVNVGSTILQILATDVDSGDNGRIVYSIENGDIHHQFTVDPVNGYITVSKPLDREKISNYKLSVKATDLGKPPLSTAVTVNIEILDINDNPPLFSKLNYSAIIQEGKAGGWSIIKLSVTDSDSGNNSGPYRFDIIEGNEDKLFKISSDGTIRTVQRLAHHAQHVFHLKIRVFDSGVPPFFSDAAVTIRVVEESQFPPSLTPKDVIVLSYEDNLKSCSLGQVHAKDPDQYDTLTYLLDKETNGFSLDPQSGEITLSNLDTGQYKLNVTVTDGKFSSSGTVNINIQPLFADMLLSSFSFRVKGMSSKNFVLTGRKNILRMLKQFLKTEIYLLSIQPANKDVDVLLSFQENISLKEFNTALINCGLPTSILKCSCQNEGSCRQRISLIQQKMITTSTEMFSFVAPAHSHRMYCACLPSYTGEACELNLEKDCDCPPPTVCSHQGGTRGYFMCASAPPVAPLCAENHTCNSSSQSSMDQFTFSYTYIIIVIIAILAISILAISSVILWKCQKHRSRENANGKKVAIDPDSICNSKINNLKFSQSRDRPSSYNCGTDTLYTALPLNNLDNIRSGSGEELGNSSCSFLQNLNKSSDNLKINNDFKNSNSMRNSFTNPEEETRLMQGYQWEQNDTPRPKVVTFMTDEKIDVDSPGPSTSPHVIIQDITVQVNDNIDDRTADYGLSYGFPHQRNISQRISGIDEPKIIS